MTKEEKFIIKFLYLLSKEKISDNLYLEGGASLKFIYNIRRKFSNDIDFTIEKEKLIPRFLKTTEKILRDLHPSKECFCRYSNNRITILNGKRELFHIDVYLLDSKLFEWEKATLKHDNKKFKIKTHTLKDILAEKICNLLQKDRFEFKDIIDTNKLIGLNSRLFRSSKFKSYLKNKIKNKSICFDKKNLIETFTNKKRNFRKSFLNNYENLNANTFNHEFINCLRIIKLFTV